MEVGSSGVIPSRVSPRSLHKTAKKAPLDNHAVEYQGEGETTCMVGAFFGTKGAIERNAQASDKVGLPNKLLFIEGILN